MGERARERYTQAGVQTPVRAPTGGYLSMAWRETKDGVTINIRFILLWENNVWKSPSRWEDRFRVNFDLQLDGGKLWRDKLPGALDMSLWSRIRSYHWERAPWEWVSRAVHVWRKERFVIILSSESNVSRSEEQIWFGISWWKAVAGQIARSLGHEPLE